MMDRIAGRLAALLAGNRHFWRSDVHAHHGAWYYNSVKRAYSLILSGGSGNSENLKGSYRVHGVQLIYRSGAEYRNVFPVWDCNWFPDKKTTVIKITLPDEAEAGKSVSLMTK